VASGALDQIKARGTLIVGIRVEAPPVSRTLGDPAHAQKRAFEIAVATLVAVAILGPQGKVELRPIGGDRVLALAQGADMTMVADAPTLKDRALVTPPYAAASIVLATKDGSSIARVEDLAGKAVAASQDEIGSRDAAQAFFQQRGIAVTLDTAAGHINGAATALDDGRASALAGDGIAVAVVAGERGLKVLAEIAPRPYVIAVRQGAGDLVTAVNAALSDALKSGAIKDAATKAGFPYTAP
jgi:ABC-type amino acid transport substrate-binding protein